MASVSAGHIILTPTQPVGSGRPQRESNPEPPHQESSALPTELPCPPEGGKEGRRRERKNEKKRRRARARKRVRERKREEREVE